jgi:HlyD family secretion protein
MQGPGDLTQFDLSAGRGAGRLGWALSLVLLLAGGLVACDRLAQLTGGDPALAAPVSAPPPIAPIAAVSARGRLAPKDGLIVIAGPSEMAVVVQRLLVDKGDRVRAGQVIAVLDQEALRRVDVERVEAQLANAEAEMERTRRLNADRVVSDSQRDSLQTTLTVTRAQLKTAQTALERQYVRAPFDGQVIDILAREGERATQGIVELGRTDRMYAIAEVYETDIRRVRLGQRARVESPALALPLEGTVDRIGRKVGKLDAIGADPAARTDARVVEVEVRLDDSKPAASLTNLQVEITLEP